MSTFANPRYFRKGTKINETSINFIFSQGGIGDYINWIPAIEWIAKENPHIKAKLIVPDYFYSLARLFLKGCNVKIFRISELKRVIKADELVCSPHDFKPYINATGAHLLDLGFMYYAALDKAPPDYNRLPVARFEDGELITMVFQLRQQYPRYAVFTPGATADARTVPALHFNRLVEYTLNLGITPVFLGSTNFSNNKNYVAKFDTNYDFSKGVDLREKTSLIEALQIMETATFVIGLDNGLLHLAACTNAPLIFGYNITTVAHREPRRFHNAPLINIYLENDQLGCIGCQSNMRFLKGHSFKTCLYNDYVCTDMLFANEGETWKSAIKTLST